jgi:hypothetical protein
VNNNNVPPSGRLVNPPNRAERRRLERLALAAAKSDACFMCGKPFPAMGALVMGTARDGREGTAGDCCKANLATIDAIGINFAPVARGARS